MALKPSWGRGAHSEETMSWRLAFDFLAIEVLNCDRGNSSLLLIRTSDHLLSPSDSHQLYTFQAVCLGSGCTNTLARTNPPSPSWGP